MSLPSQHNIIVKTKIGVSTLLSYSAEEETKIDILSAHHFKNVSSSILLNKVLHFLV